MAWERKNFEVWSICWWAIFPYPCKKTVTKYCCRGVHKYRTFIIFVVEHYFCCDRHEHHWWSFDLSLNIPYWIITRDAEICKDSPPDESEGCPNSVGDAPPPAGGGQWGENALVQAGGGAISGSIVATLIAITTSGSAQQTGVAVLAGAIVGAAFGSGIGQRWGCALKLLVLLVVIIILFLIYSL